MQCSQAISARDAISGTLEGGSGKIGNVPLLIDEAAGNWRYLNNVLTFDSSLKVLDAEQVDRFQPMNVPDMMLTLENSVITAIGHLVEPKTRYARCRCRYPT